MSRHNLDLDLDLVEIGSIFFEQRRHLPDNTDSFDDFLSGIRA